MNLQTAFIRLRMYFPPAEYNVAIDCGVNAYSFNTEKVFCRWSVSVWSGPSCGPDLIRGESEKSLEDALLQVLRVARARTVAAGKLIARPAVHFFADAESGVAE